MKLHRCKIHQSPREKPTGLPLLLCMLSMQFTGSKLPTNIMTWKMWSILCLYLHALSCFVRLSAAMKEPLSSWVCGSSSSVFSCWPTAGWFAWLWICLFTVCVSERIPALHYSHKYWMSPNEETALTSNCRTSDGECQCLFVLCIVMWTSTDTPLFLCIVKSLF